MHQIKVVTPYSPYYFLMDNGLRLELTHFNDRAEDLPVLYLSKEVKLFNPYKLPVVGREVFEFEKNIITEDGVLLSFKTRIDLQSILDCMSGKSVFLGDSYFHHVNTNSTSFVNLFKGVYVDRCEEADGVAKFYKRDSASDIILDEMTSEYGYMLKNVDIELVMQTHKSPIIQDRFFCKLTFKNKESYFFSETEFFNKDPLVLMYEIPAYYILFYDLNCYDNTLTYIDIENLYYSKPLSLEVGEKNYPPQRGFRIVGSPEMG